MRLSLSLKEDTELESQGKQRTGHARMRFRKDNGLSETIVYGHFGKLSKCFLFFFGESLLFLLKDKQEVFAKVKKEEKNEMSKMSEY